MAYINANLDFGAALVNAPARSIPIDHVKIENLKKCGAIRASNMSEKIDNLGQYVDTIQLAMKTPTEAFLAIALLRHIAQSHLSHIIP